MKPIYEHCDKNPLLMAAKRGQLSSVKLLVSKGANVNISLKESGITAVHNAAHAGHLSIVEFLVSEGAN